MTPAGARLARRFSSQPLLRVSLLVGAVYDAAFAVLMLVAPQLPARLLALPLPPLPAGAFYLRILAVLLFMLAALYVCAARDPVRNRAVVAVAIGGRLVGGTALLASAWRGTGLDGLYPLAAADLGFGLAHAAFWRSPEA
jgi:hypothetical protein